MKIVCISDTHGVYLPNDMPDGDVLIHAGDLMSNGYNEREITDFNNWLGELPYSWKLVIAGNHDWLFEKRPTTKDMLTNAVYLEDSGVQIDGTCFWGSPVQPEFFGWAFNRKRGDDIQRHWDLIPEGTDVLITHGPPAGFRDWMRPGTESLGCRNLRDTVARIKPKVHIFGHIHGGHGEDHDGVTHFVNAALLDEKYRPAYKPIVVEI